MPDLDLNGPAPHPETLAEAQQVIAWLWATHQALRAQIEVLEERLKSDSGDSSKLPSSDTPEQWAKRPKKPRSGKSQGAQPGHRKHERAVVAESEVDHVERFYPQGDCDCGDALAIADEPAVRHQVFDLPEGNCQLIEMKS